MTSAKLTISVTNYCCGEGADKLSTPTILALSEQDGGMSTTGLEPITQELMEEDMDIDLTTDSEDWSPSGVSDTTEDCADLDVRSRPSTPSEEIADAELSDQSEASFSMNENNEISMLAARVSESIDNLLHTASLIRDYNADKDLNITQRYGTLSEDRSLEQGSPTGAADGSEAVEPVHEMENDENVMSAEKGRTVTEAFEALVEPMLRREFGSGFQQFGNTFLKHRLFTAMVWRWRRVCYRNHHASELADVSAKPKVPESAHGFPPELPKNLPVTATEATMPQTKGTGSSFHVGSTVASNAVLTQRVIVPSATTKSSRAGTRHTELPPVPEWDLLSTEYMYKCPYCRRLPVLPGLSHKIWK